MQGIEDILKNIGGKTGKDLERQAQNIENKRKKEKIRGKKQNRKERKKYAHSTFMFLKSYTIILVTIILLSGLNGKYLDLLDFSKFHLSDPVLITLITTSLGSIVSVFVFVMKYLFKGK